MRMYEARQNKEKTSRIISLMKNKELKPINGNIVKNTTICSYKKINRPSIQKMVVYDGKNPPVDMNVITTLPNIEDSCQKPVFNNNESYSYEDCGKIGILSHGSPTLIDWKNESLNGEQFAKQELIAKGIKSGTNLEIWSCNAGSEGNDKAKPLVDAIWNQLVENGINIYIKGVIGAHVILNDNNEHYSLKEEKVDDFTKLRNRLLVEVGFFPTTFLEEDYDDAIRDLKELWVVEKVGDYTSYVGEKRSQWLMMCEKIRNYEERASIIGNPISDIWRKLPSLSDVSELFE